MILQLVLPVICTLFVFLVALGKVKVIWFPRPQQQELIAEVVAPTLKKRGRPRKGEKTKTHHLHLPPMSANAFYDVNDFFKGYADSAGDQVVLHLSNATGAEESIEVPYPVRWNAQVKERLSDRLGGWV